MNKTISVVMEKDLAEALYSRLLSPVALQDGATAYSVGINLAFELRMLLSKALEGK